MAAPGVVDAAPVGGAAPAVDGDAGVATGVRLGCAVEPGLIVGTRVAVGRGVGRGVGFGVGRAVGVGDGQLPISTGGEVDVWGS